MKDFLRLPARRLDHPHTSGSRLVRVVGPVGLILALASCGGAHGTTLSSACNGLAGTTIEGFAVTAARYEPASNPSVEQCVIQATLAPELDVEMRLPAKWSGRIVQSGGGGFDGTIPNLTGTFSTQLLRGDAVVGSNGGHRIVNGLNGERLVGNDGFRKLWGYQSVGLTAAFSRTASKTLYGAAPQRAYFSGCSNGGREAAVAAAYYGSSFDGVLAASAPVEQTGIATSHWVRLGQWLAAAPANALTAEKAALVDRAVLAKCDGLDGLEDGLISRPDACTFDPQVLRCPAGTDNGSCLTNAQIQTVTLLTGDFNAANGKVGYSGYYWGNSSGLVRTPSGGFFNGSLLGFNFVKFLIGQDVGADPLAYDISRYAEAQLIMDEIRMDPKPSEIAQFLVAGKKAIFSYGAADPLQSARDGLRNYLETSSIAGATGKSNSRFFQLAGVNHCRGGAGADSVDLLTPLMNWVETGASPETALVAEKKARDGSTTFARPLCPYPSYPKYIGGDSAKAASFACSAE